MKIWINSRPYKSKSRIDDILYLIKKNGFSLIINEDPTRDKIERIKLSINRRRQLALKTIEHFKKDN